MDGNEVADVLRLVIGCEKGGNGAGDGNGRVREVVAESDASN